MRNFPFELIYFLIFIALFLYQYLKKMAARQAEREAAPEPTPPRPVPVPYPVAYEPSFERQARAALAPAPISASDFGRRPPVSTVASDLASALTRPRRPRRFSRQALFGSRQDVQKAVVIATILGPCRALERLDEPRREAPRGFARRT